MKTEISIIISSLFVVTILAFGFFYSSNFSAYDKNLDFGLNNNNNNNNNNKQITGFVVNNQTTFEEINTSLNEKITKEVASSLIREAEQIINKTRDSGLPTLLMEDNLLEAKRIFEQAIYAEILREEVNVSKKQKQDAQNALRLINWKNINYNGVLIYTDKINEIEKQETLLKDTILIRKEEVKALGEQMYSIGLFSSQRVDTSQSDKIIEEINIAFREERFGDVEKLLLELRDSLEKEKQDASTLANLKLGTMNFFQRYWIFIILFLSAFVLIGIKFYKNINIKILKNRIFKMKTEKQVLLNLMKKVQIERFKENKISGLVYNIRTKKYKEMENEIKEKLPVLEEKLKKLLKEDRVKKK